MSGMLDMDIWSLVLDTGPVIKLVFVILLAMSLATWSLIFLKWHELRRARARACADRTAFEAAADLAQAMNRPDRDPEAACCRVTGQGMDELRRMADMDMEPAVKGRIILESVRHALQDEADAQSERLYGSLSYLATFGNVAPLLGLFGTVWGIMDSFSGLTGGADTVSGVAPGLAAALSTTAFGLIVAIPAVLAFNGFVKMLGSIESELARLKSAFMNRVKEELADILTCTPRNLG
ncbi:MAG: MotA/TolQ/ExbB proton channel family protein [Desulfovibrionaceae bacterium]